MGDDRIRGEPGSDDSSDGSDLFSAIVGGKFLGRFEQRNRRVRCLVRKPENLKARVVPGIEVVAGNVLDPGSLATAMHGVEVAYYLVHSMGPQAPRDR